MVANINTPKKGDLHPVVEKHDPKEEGHGKETGLIKAPVVSVNPSSGDTVKEDKKEPRIFDNVLFKEDEEKEDFPFAKLKAGQGFFVPATEHESTDFLVEKFNKQINEERIKYAEVEKDENGDEILEVVTIKTRKRNDDGTLQLEGGKVITGANQSHRFKYIYARNFMCKPVMKDDDIGHSKAEHDGVLVVRVF